jgi:hypothetical protein
MRKRKHKVAGISVFVVYQLKSRQQFTCSNRAFKAINYRHGRAIGSETSLGAFCSPDSGRLASSWSRMKGYCAEWTQSVLRRLWAYTL